MKKLIITAILFLALSSQVFPDVSGLPFTDDQYAHIFGAAYLTKLCKSYGIQPLETAFIVLAVSLAKEQYDSRTTGFSTEDISYSMSGVLLSYSVDFILDI